MYLLDADSTKIPSESLVISTIPDEKHLGEGIATIVTRNWFGQEISVYEVTFLATGEVDYYYLHQLELVE